MENGHKGIKLLELAMVLAMLGSVGFTVIPQFTQAGTEDYLVNMVGILHQIRCQIDLYKAQHDSVFPPGEAFEKVMTQKDSLGFGPYMGQMPLNPFNKLSSVRITTVADQGQGRHGWCYNPETGDFYADDNKCHSQL